MYDIDQIVKQIIDTDNALQRCKEESRITGRSQALAELMILLNDKKFRLEQKINEFENELAVN
jgi:hypothetical protein